MTLEERKEAERQRRKRWYLSHPKYYAHYRETHREEIAESSRRYSASHLEKLADKQRRYNQKIKAEVLSHYSEGECPECSRCGDKRLVVLSIDHIKGGGGKHIKSLGIGGGFQLYLWLRREGYPEGFQVLCANCQMIKKVERNECHRKPD